MFWSELVHHMTNYSILKWVSSSSIQSSLCHHVKNMFFSVLCPNWRTYWGGVTSSYGVSARDITNDSFYLPLAFSNFTSDWHNRFHIWTELRGLLLKKSAGRWVLFEMSCRYLIRKSFPSYHVHLYKALHRGNRLTHKNLGKKTCQKVVKSTNFWRA